MLGSASWQRRAAFGRLHSLLSVDSLRTPSPMPSRPATRGSHPLTPKRSKAKPAAGSRPAKHSPGISCVLRRPAGRQQKKAETGERSIKAKPANANTSYLAASSRLLLSPTPHMLPSAPGSKRPTRRRIKCRNSNKK